MCLEPKLNILLFDEGDCSKRKKCLSFAIFLLFYFAIRLGGLANELCDSSVCLPRNKQSGS